MRAKHFFVVAVASLAIALVAGCDKSNNGATPDPDSGKLVKRACKMQGKCYLCPDDEAMKKCILNPSTSGCKPASDADCEISK